MQFTLPVLQLAGWKVQCLASSSMRELLALAQALTRDLAFFPPEPVSSSCKETTRPVPGSSSTVPETRSFIKVVFAIKCKEQDFGIRVIPAWTPRLHPRLVLADAGSRLSSSTDEWFVDRTDLAGIFAFFSFSPDTDCYSASHDAVSPHFFSKVPQNGSAGIDFLTQYPKTVNHFLCLPVSVILAALHHVTSFVDMHMDWANRQRVLSLNHPLICSSYLFLIFPNIEKTGHISYLFFGHIVSFCFLKLSYMPSPI